MTTHDERVLDLRQTYNHAYSNAFRMAVLGAQDVDRMIDRIARLEEQIGKLADCIIEFVPGEPSQSEGATECAVRLLKKAYS